MHKSLLTITILLAQALPAARAQEPAPRELLRGRVRAAPGESLGGALVRARRAPDAAAALLGELRGATRRDRFEAAIDARGAFRLAVPPRARWTVRAVSRDGTFASSIVRGAHGGRLLALRMRPACHVEVAGSLRLRWQLWAFDRERRDFFALEDGVLTRAQRRLPPLPPGRYRLRLLAPDQRACEFVPLVLGPGERRTLAPVLRAPASLELRLRDYDGPATLVVPNELAAPAAQGEEGERGELRTRLRVSFVRGRCALALPGLDLAMALTLERPGEAPHGFYVAPLASGKTLARRLDAADTRRVTVDAPEPGRAVVLWDRFGLGRRSFALRAGEQVLDGIPDSDCLVLFRSAASGALACTATRGSETAGRARLELSEPGRLRLKIRGPGEVLREARVRAWPTRLQGALGLEPLYPTLETISARDGSASLDGLPPGTWTVRVDAAPFVSLEWAVQVAAGETVDEAARLELGRKVFGRVFDPQGRPAPRTMVSLDDPLPHERVGPRYATTEDDGSFEFLGLPDGVYRVEAIQAGGAFRVVARVLARPGDAARLRLRSDDPEIRRTPGIDPPPAEDAGPRKRGP